MAESANSNSSSTKSTDDFFDITKFPEIDKAFIASIWGEEQKNGKCSKPGRLARLIRSIEADISTPNEGLDSFTYSEVSSSLSVPEQADDDPNSSSACDIEMYVDLTAYSKINGILNRTDDREANKLRIPKEKAAMESKREGDGNGSKQKLKKGRKWKK